MKTSRRVRHGGGPRGRSRRGVLLLLVLALLAMFAMLTMSYLAISNQAKTSADAGRSVGQLTDSGSACTSQGLRQALVGQNNPADTSGQDSLLEKLYGPNTLRVTIASATTNNGMTDVTFQGADQNEILQRSGCPITMISGAAKGQTVYIGGVGSSGNLQLPAFPNGTTPKAGDMCVINGHPYSADENRDFTSLTNMPLLNVPAAGTATIDNTGSGTPDSIPVPIPGLPTQWTGDGRTTQPSIAMTVKELDGRLNLNAHGCLTHTQTTDPMGRGFGHGPADINLRWALGANWQTAYTAILNGRYGSDNTPGPNGALNADRWLGYSGNYPGNDAYGSPPDPQGCLVASLNALGQVQYAGIGANPFQLTGNPYETLLAPGGPRGTLPGAPDALYGLAELERLLRAYDRDAPMLPPRLVNLAGGILLQNRDLWTTESSHINLCTISIGKLLLQRNIQPTVWSQLLPADVLAGRKFDINSAILNAQTQGAGPQLVAKQQIAQTLYVLMSLLIGDGSPAKARAIAQWSANVVDFCDRDSAMTFFPYCVDFTSGWNPDGSTFVFGCERPELVLTEALALHDRRTEPQKDEDNQPKAGEPFQQRFRPQGSLFVELYNPWSPMEPTSIELAGAGGGVDLSKVAGGSPVWRLIIVRNPNPTDNTVEPDEAGLVIERAVYFCAAGSATLPAGGQVKYSPTNPAGQTTPTVMPGSYAVIGSGDDNAASPSATRTYLGFKTGTSDGDNPARYGADARYIDLGNAGLIVNNGDTVPPDGNRVRMVINSPRRLNVSEPVGGYTMAGFDSSKEFSATPLPNALDTDATLGATELGTRTGVCAIYLQRLADPTRAFDATTNPYRTIDAIPVDLTVFNGVTNLPEPSVTQGAIGFQSRQRGETNAPAGTMNLWKREQLNKAAAGSGDAGGDYYFKKKLGHTLGYLNTPFNGGGKVFPWLTWVNRPLVSSTEMILTPRYSPWQLMATYDLPYYPHFPFTGASAGWHRIFELVGVRSGFVRRNTTDGKLDVIESGRININTMSAQAYEALRNNIPGMPDYAAFSQGRPFRSFGAPTIEQTILRPGLVQPVAVGMNDPDRSPYFRYQPLIRLSNLVTTQSNVFAVWVTVTYSQTGAGMGELGNDTGEITRHRAFYIIDRSIPVGFVRGQDLNTNNAVLLRRFIE